MKQRLLCMICAGGILMGNVLGVLPVGAEEKLGDVEVFGLTIHAVNGGYSAKIEDKTVSNNWDFIELTKTYEGEVDLAGYSVKYTRSSGTSDRTDLFGVLSGEALLMRYRNSPQKDGNFFYSFDLAAGGGKVELLYMDEVIDAVSWGSVGVNDGRYGREEYWPEYDEVKNEWWEPELEEEVGGEGEGGVEVEAQCFELMFTEIYSYFEENYSEQFVEIFNPTAEIIGLEGCALRYKNKNYALGGAIGAGEYLAYSGEEMKLTKNPTTNNFIELIDVTGDAVARMEWGNGQKKGVSWALIGEDEAGMEIWALSYARTPGAENVYQEYRSCAEGKAINPETGNCVNVVTTAVLAECGPGKIRNPETNRCKSIESEAAGLAPCAEGYYRNPETNRCRKIRENNGADYGVTPISYTDKSAFMAYGALAAVATSGVLYVIFQFRKEISKPFRLLSDKIKA